MIFKKFIILLFCVYVSLNSFSQISGFVFRDFNLNGTKDNTATFNEPFVTGITVKAFNAANIQLGGIKTTDASGAFSFSIGEIPATTAVRIEFSGMGTGDFNSVYGSGNGTNIQFVSAPSTTVNFAINAADDYWNNVTQTDPVLAIVHNRRGRNDGFYAGKFSLLQVNNSSSSSAPPATTNTISIDTGQTIAARRGATYLQTGSCFGLAFQQISQRLFQTATLKRGFGFGTKGPGGIYILNKGATYAAYTASFDLQGVTPANGGTVLDFGTVTRVNSPTSNDNYLSNLAGSSSSGDTRDNDAFAKVGTMSYGDIEADKATDKLYTINLFQKRLLVLDVENTSSATLNNATAATLGPLVRAYDLTTLAGWPAATGAGNNLRPYAVKIYKGTGYLGVVCDAMNTQSRADLKGYILSFDPNNINAGFSTVLNFNFSSYGNTNLDGVSASDMKPWVRNFTDVIAATGATLPLGPQQCPQPMIATIEFNENGSMDIGIRDRWGDQGAVYEFTPVPGSTSHQQTVIGGDLLHACKTSSGWVMEGTAGSCVQPGTNSVATNNDWGQGASFQNTGKEWYADKSGDGNSENIEAGLTKLMGTDKIIISVYDPMPAGITLPAGNVYLSTQGIQWNNVNTGAKTQWARTIPETGGAADKCNGLGDLELILDPMPLQIGDRVWNDLNDNGLQDANETTPPVTAGTLVTLRSSGLDGIYNTSDDQTWTTTTDATGYYYFSVLGTADNRKPALWSGIGNNILPGFDYRLEMALPNGFIVTKKDISNNTSDQIDNDAAYYNSYAIIDFNTKNTNHSYDFGFIQANSIGDRVWGDLNTNGQQDPNETGVPNIKVMLYNNSLQKVDSTITDVNGYWFLKNIPTSTNYFVSFTNQPANLYWTIANIGDLNSQVKTGGINDSDKDSDANPDGFTLPFDVNGLTAEYKIDAGLSSNMALLPTNFIELTAVKILQTVLLDFKIPANTAGAIGSFTIERSIDGITFYAIAVINKTANLLYQYSDNTLFGYGTIYYRIKEAKPGSTLYSNTCSVKQESKAAFIAFPNPSKGIINLLVTPNSFYMPFQIKLFNMAGVLELQKNINTPKDAESIRLQHVANGIYQLQISKNNKILNTQKIIISK